MANGLFIFIPLWKMKSAFAPASMQMCRPYNVLQWTIKHVSLNLISYFKPVSPEKSLETKGSLASVQFKCESMLELANACCGGFIKNK